MLDPITSPSARDRSGGRRRRVRAAACAVAALAVALPASAEAAQTQFVGWGTDSGGFPHAPVPAPVVDAAGATAAAVAGDRSFVLTVDGVRGRGVASYGGLGLGDGSLPDASAFTAIPGTAGALAVSAGATATLVLKGDGSVLAFGGNAYGDAGAEPGTIVGSPTAVAGLAGVRAISSGYNASFALKADGSIWTWGRRDTLGSQAAYDGGDRGTPTQVELPAGTTATAISGGGLHALALLSDGTVAAWGRNSQGQIGDGSTPAAGNVLTSAARVFTPPPGVTVRSISAGYLTSFALLSDGSFRAWAQHLRRARTRHRQR